MTLDELRAYKIKDPAARRITRQLLQQTACQFLKALFFPLVKGVCWPFIEDRRVRLKGFPDNDRVLYYWRYYDSSEQYPTVEFEKIVIRVVMNLYGPFFRRPRPMPVPRQRSREEYEWACSLAFDHEGLPSMEMPLLIDIWQRLERRLPENFYSSRARGLPGELKREGGPYTHSIAEELIAELDQPGSLVRLFLLVAVDMIIDAINYGAEGVDMMRREEREERNKKDE